jgi:hypothetical protein
MYIVWRNGNEVRIFDRLSQIKKFRKEGEKIEVYKYILGSRIKKIM